MTADQHEKPVVLLAGLDHLRALLAENLLTEAGIPCMLHGPDFGAAEGGQAEHDDVFGRNLLVYWESVQAARELLQEAWGEENCRRFLLA